MNGVSMYTDELLTLVEHFTQAAYIIYMDSIHT